ncbi:hypothetical protein DPMN_116640 [Dreissena polymorpha]|uniref:Uncharacterized protein n=1 Tax=Dreissena polymorpha TaxID=45954 RepID=A0A9D4QU48_DREPO|nr:hypothetical protein DPMN_116640 [Dreissena polymorpha]
MGCKLVGKACLTSANVFVPYDRGVEFQGHHLNGAPGEADTQTGEQSEPVSQGTAVLSI